MTSASSSPHLVMARRRGDPQGSYVRAGSSEDEVFEETANQPHHRPPHKIERVE